MNNYYFALILQLLLLFSFFTQISINSFSFLIFLARGIQIRPVSFQLKKAPWVLTDSNNLASVDDLTTQRTICILAVQRKFNNNTKLLTKKLRNTAHSLVLQKTALTQTKTLTLLSVNKT